MGRREVLSFFEKHYGPKNLTIAIVGDTSPEEVRYLALGTLLHSGWKPEANP